MSVFHYYSRTRMNINYDNFFFLYYPNTNRRNKKKLLFGRVVKGYSNYGILYATYPFIFLWVKKKSDRIVRRAGRK